MGRRLWVGLLCAALVAPLLPAMAAEPFSITVTLKNHRFEPAELHVPSGRRILIKVVNQDAMSEEFDSTALKVEKVIAANSEGTVRISALDPGRYEFVGEYHSETAKGVVIAE